MGTIRMFNADKGWGFIDSDAGKDIFLHAKHIVGGAPRFWIGHKSCTKDLARAPKTTMAPVRVAFDLAVSGNGKPQALNVRLLDGMPAEFCDPAMAPSLAEGDFMESALSDPAEDFTCRQDSGSRLCGGCGSTIAVHLGISACQVCRLWCTVPSQ